MNRPLALVRLTTSRLSGPFVSRQPWPFAVFLIHNDAACTRSYFTNTDLMKRDDPYARLGLTWGATVSEIKEAYRTKARALHPDVSPEAPDVALKKFQEIQKAYNTLMDVKGAPHRDDLREEWSFAVWRNSDVLAQEPTDVAGVLKKRPAKPAGSQTNPSWGGAMLGHPSGGGVVTKRGEYLNGGLATKQSSTVGTGQSKWVTPREFRPWNPHTAAGKRASDRIASTRRKSKETTKTEETD